MNELLDAALGYVRAILLVFPLHTVTGDRCSCGQPSTHRSAGKHPRTLRGFLDATTEEAKIRAWWTKWPDAGIATPLGPGRGVVLDVDPRHNGDASLAALVAEHGLLPEGPLARTGGGGTHYWFAWPGGTVPIAHGFREGLDLQSDGTYVVLPPSPHPSGRRYEWVRPLIGAHLPLPPPWLLEAAEGRSAAKRKFVAGADGRIPHGRHHDLIVSTTASLTSRIAGLDEPGLIAAARGALTPLLDDIDQHDAEIRDAARSALAKFGRPVAKTPLPADPASEFAERLGEGHDRARG